MIRHAATLRNSLLATIRLEPFMPASTTQSPQGLSILIVDASCDDDPQSRDRCFAFRALAAAVNAQDPLAELAAATLATVRNFEKAGFFTQTLSVESAGLDGAASVCVSGPSGQDAFLVAQKALLNRFGEAFTACGPFSLGQDGALSSVERELLADFLS